MPYVADKEQVEAFQAYSSEPGFSQEVLSVEFTTSEEFVKSVLPPGLQPADTPTGSISVSTWESKLCGEFDCTMVAIYAKHEGVVGRYILTLLISNDMPVTWGREIWGEVKKTGDSRLFRSGNKLYAYGQRNGVRLVELTADLGPDLEPNVTEEVGYEIKAYPSATGIGLESEPKLVTLFNKDHNTKRSVGKGSLILRGTKSDPLHEIPVDSIGEFSYVSGVTEWRVTNVKELGVGDAYLPYLIGRHYDDLRVFKVGSTLGENEEEDQTPFKVQRLKSR